MCVLRRKAKNVDKKMKDDEKAAFNFNEKVEIFSDLKRIDTLCTLLKRAKKAIFLVR